jgi:hypothetical protein
MEIQGVQGHGGRLVIYSGTKRFSMAPRDSISTRTRSPDFRNRLLHDPSNAGATSLDKSTQFHEIDPV